MLRNDLYAPWFSGDSDWGFEILDGEFKDVVVQISNLQFRDDQTEDGSLDVEYHVISSPEIVKEELSSDLFKAVFETIINDIIKEAIENFANEQDRDSNT